MRRLRLCCSFFVTSVRRWEARFRRFAFSPTRRTFVASCGCRGLVDTMVRYSNGCLSAFCCTFVSSHVRVRSHVRANCLFPLVDMCALDIMSDHVRQDIELHSALPVIPTHASAQTMKGQKTLIFQNRSVIRAIGEYDAMSVFKNGWPAPIMACICFLTKNCVLLNN